MTTPNDDQPAADLVERVARAICAASFHPDDAPISWKIAGRWGDHAKWQRFAQAALTDARPVIEAQTREACAKVAENAVEWLPIASAPKDGTAILVWPVWSQAEGDADKDICAPAYWNTWYPDAPHWREATGEHYERYEPTHWRPLPPPPVTEAKRQPSAS